MGEYFPEMSGIYDKQQYITVSWICNQHSIICMHYIFLLKKTSQDCMWTATASMREKNKQTSADQEIWHWLSNSLKHWVHTLKLVCLLDALAKWWKHLTCLGWKCCREKSQFKQWATSFSLSPLLQARRLKCPFSVWQDIKWRVHGMCTLWI